MADQDSFVCLQCGRCCSDLVSEDHGIFRGLTLLPEEKKVFPKSSAKPAVGIGNNPKDSGFRIIAYQLTEVKCPHLQDNLCIIYQNRPASCRQFPFSLRISSERKKQMGFDLNCPALVGIFKKNPRPRFDFAEKSHAEKLLDIYVTVLSNPTIAWYFDLKTEKWILYSELTN